MRVDDVVGYAILLFGLLCTQRASSIMKNKEYAQEDYLVRLCFGSEILAVIIYLFGGAAIAMSGILYMVREQ
ncbi:MAG: hypothetical protein KC646_00780 [Candidatus Cloacimonetes bacterium]|nr:hypothetical protein [Candidatus Cloacimonadota bacterium]